jgi:hypothetical protein
MKKLADYLKMHWVIHAEQHQLQKPTLNVLLDWVNQQNYIASKIDLEASKQISKTELEQVGYEPVSRLTTNCTALVNICCEDTEDYSHQLVKVENLLNNNNRPLTFLSSKV